MRISDWSSDVCSSDLSVVKAAISALIAPEKSSEIVFPQGTIRFNAEGLAAIARTHGGGWDIDLIADAYRQQMRSEEHTSELQSLMRISYAVFCLKKKKKSKKSIIIIKKEYTNTRENYRNHEDNLQYNNNTRRTT